MSCGAGAASFRLLDGYVGWEVASFADAAKDLEGFADPAGVHLLRLSAGSGSVTPAQLAGAMPPPRLARGCEPCEWLLATPSPPAARLLRLDGCDLAWDRLWPGCPSAPGPEEIVAVAVHRHLLAVAEPGGRIWVWTRYADRLVAVFDVPQPIDLAFVSGCELLVASAAGPTLLRFDASGVPRGELEPPLPDLGGAVLDRLEVAADGSIWLASRHPDDTFDLWHLAAELGGEGEDPPKRCYADRFVLATRDELFASLPATGITAVDDRGFCLAHDPERHPSPHSCFSWFGRPVASLGEDLAADTYAQRGQLLTGPIDSGVPRCRWHRVRIEADVPSGTTVQLAVSASESATPDNQGVVDPEWIGFPAGPQHPDDWHKPAAGPTDFLIDQPPGRYLFVRLRLTGDGSSTPIVRRIRLDFPRATSLDFLPSVYREEPLAEEFTERFLSLFDAGVADLDRAVERFPALFDTAGVPAEVLPWLGEFLDVSFDPAWDTERRRKILRALPELLPLRGTLAGLAGAIRLVFDADVVIEEAGRSSFWGAVAPADAGLSTPLDARLGAVRLFSRARSRFRLGASRLSQAPVRSYGDPDLDPITAGAHRFRVLVPAGVVEDEISRRRLERLVDSLKPAHTIASLHVGSSAGLVTAGRVAVGIDTRLGAPAPPVLGARGTARLGRDSILRSRRHGAHKFLVVGQTSAVGLTC